MKHVCGRSSPLGIFGRLLEAFLGDTASCYLPLPPFNLSGHPKAGILEAPPLRLPRRGPDEGAAELSPCGGRVGGLRQQYRHARGVAEHFGAQLDRAEGDRRRHKLSYTCVIFWFCQGRGAG